MASKIDPTDGKWLVTTSRGLIKASKIVFATNGYTAGIAPEYAKKIVPCRGICARITGLNGSPLPYLQNSYVIRSGPGIYDYLLSRPDGSVVIGGARSTFLHNKKTWYDTTNDDELIEPARNYFDGFMQKSFRGWENTGAITERVWTGSRFPNFSFNVIFLFFRCFFPFFLFFSHGFRQLRASMQVPVIRYHSSRDTCLPHLQFRQDRVYSMLQSISKKKKKSKMGKVSVLTKI